MKITNHIKYVITFMAIILMTGFAVVVQAQPQRASHQQVKFLVERIERGTDNFRASLKDALDQSRFNETKREHNVNQFVTDFENAADRLKDRFSDNNTAVGAVEDVLQRAALIDGYMRTHRLTPHAQADWDYLRQNLNSLARAYDVAWSWFGVHRAPYRVSHQYMKDLLARIEDKADRFSKSLDKGLDRSRFDGTKAEDNINQSVSEFEVTTDRLADQFNDQHTAVGRVSEMLRHAARIDNFMQRHRLTPAAHDDWRSLRQDLETLARAYDVSMNWRGATIILR